MQKISDKTQKFRLSIEIFVKNYIQRENESENESVNVRENESESVYPWESDDGD